MNVFKLFGLFSLPIVIGSVFLATANADCPSVEAQEAGSKISVVYPAGTSTIFLQRGADGSALLSLEATGTMSGAVSTARVPLLPSQFSSLLVSVSAPTKEVPDLQVIFAEILTWVFPDGSLTFAIRALQEDNSYSDLIVQQAADGSLLSPPQCLSESKGFDWLAFSESQSAKLPDAVAVFPQEYSPPCPDDVEVCGGPFIFSPISDVAATGGAGAGRGSVVEARNLLLTATRTSGLSNRKALLRRARGALSSYLAHHPNLARPRARNLQKALKAAQKAERQRARSPEVSAAIRALLAESRSLR